MSADVRTKPDNITLDSQGTAAASGNETRALALTILYHPRLDRVGERVLLRELSGRSLASLSRVEPVFAPPGKTDGEPLGDEHLSRKPILLARTPDGSVRIDTGESSTAVTLRGNRLQGGANLTADEIDRGVVIELGHRVVVLLHWLSSVDKPLRASEIIAASELVGASDSLKRVLSDIHNVADLVLPVLLRGETGSGKELVARAIHRTSPRRDKPFVAVNLGAISPSLAVAELFGAEKGSFTGSVKRQVGYFEQAHGGTLFLDEIGEAPVELQVALLRTLETGEIQTVGASQSRKIDVRVIAATDADLEDKVEAGTFRAPLLNRLAAFEVWIAPLRERRDDMGRLLVRFLEEELREVGESSRLALTTSAAKPWLPASIVARLADYDWPGNVRQLRNVVRQLVISNRGKDRAEMIPAVERLLVRQEKPLPITSGIVAATKTPVDESVANRRKPADVTEGELREVLRASRWDLAAAAERLGVSRASIYLLFERFPGFRTASDLDVEEITRCHREFGGDRARMAERFEVSERALARRIREIGLT